MHIPPLRANRVLGVSIEGFKWRFALLVSSGSQVTVERLYELSYPESGRTEEVKKFQGKLEEILAVHAGDLIVSGLSAEQVKLRQVSLEVNSEHLIKEALPFQLEPLISYPVEDASYNYYVRKNDEESYDLSVFVTKKEFLEQHPLSRGEMTAELLSCAPIALGHLMQLNMPNKKDAFLIYPEQERTTCVLVENGIPTSCRYLQGGVTTDPQTLALEIARTYEGMNQRQKVLPELISLVELSKELQAELKKALAQELTPFKLSPEWQLPQIYRPSYLEAIAYASLALDVPTSSPLVHFPTSTLPSQGQMKRMGFKLLPTMALYFALLVAFSFFAGSFALRAKNYARALHKEVIQEVRVKTGREIMPPSALQEKEQIYHTASQVRKLLKSTEYPFPLAPDHPRVKDLLAWLSSHPKVVAGDKSLIELQKLTYTLNKRPHKKSPKEHYQVKVDLEFTSELPRYAREFHEALQQEKAWIDPKFPLNWTPKKNSYLLSFILRDRTPYAKGSK